MEILFYIFIFLNVHFDELCCSRTQEKEKMRCPYCPKEIKEDKSYMRRIGKKEYVSNPDYDKHIKKHIKTK